MNTYECAQTILRNYFHIKQNGDGDGDTRDSNTRKTRYLSEYTVSRKYEYSDSYFWPHVACQHSCSITIAEPSDWYRVGSGSVLPARRSTNILGTCELYPENMSLRVLCYQMTGSHYTHRRDKTRVTLPSAEVDTGEGIALWRQGAICRDVAFFIILRDITNHETLRIQWCSFCWRLASNLPRAVHFFSTAFTEIHLWERHSTVWAKQTRHLMFARVVDIPPTLAIFRWAKCFAQGIFSEIEHFSPNQRLPWCGRSRAPPLSLASRNARRLEGGQFVPQKWSASAGRSLSTCFSRKNRCGISPAQNLWVCWGSVEKSPEGIAASNGAQFRDDTLRWEMVTLSSWHS